MKEEKWQGIVPALSLAIGSLKRPAYKKKCHNESDFKTNNYSLLINWSLYSSLRQMSTQNDQNNAITTFYIWNYKLEIKDNKANKDRHHVYMTSIIIL